jgi:spore photoproduct lyase
VAVRGPKRGVEAAPLERRLGAMRAMALAGYPVGLTIAPIMPVDGWEAAYDGLLDEAAAALADVPELDLTAELITHRFTPTSKDVLLGWYPATKLEMDEERRTLKRGRYGSRKYVHPRATMTALRGWFEDALAEKLPAARVLYFT